MYLHCPASLRKPLDSLTIVELQDERAFWDAQVEHMERCGSLLPAQVALELRDACDALLARKGGKHEPNGVIGEKVKLAQVPVIEGVPA